MQGTGTPDSTKRTFENVILDADWVQSDLISQKSILDGTRRFLLQGSYSEFSILIYLHKNSTPSTTLQTLFTYHGETVKVFPYIWTDSTETVLAAAVQDSTGIADAEFTLTEIIPGEQGEPGSGLDIVTVKFVSNSYTDASASIQ